MFADAGRSAAGTRAVLRIDYLSLPGLPALSFEIEARQCLAIEGPSGCGKTRLLRAIADLDPAAGYVFLEGVERREVPGPEWRRRVRYAAAEPAWWRPTAREHVPATDKLDRLLAALALDGALLDRPIGELSVGERQRLALLRAIADEPQVLLLDEPTSALDSQMVALAEELIKFQMLAGRTLVLVSRDAAQIARLAHMRLRLTELAGARADGEQQQVAGSLHIEAAETMALAPQQFPAGDRDHRQRRHARPERRGLLEDELEQEAQNPELQDHAHGGGGEACFQPQTEAERDQTVDEEQQRRKR